MGENTVRTTDLRSFLTMSVRIFHDGIVSMRTTMQVFCDLQRHLAARERRG